MSSFFQRHADQDLVRYLDGELSAPQAAKVHRHLEACGQCRAELEELQSTLAECVSFRSAQKAQSPEAPQPWRDLYRDFSRIDESLANESLLVRLMRPLVHAGAPKWSFVTGLAALVVLIAFNQLRQAPSVQAASILKRAIQVSENKARPTRRIRVRTSHQQEFTRQASVQAGDPQSAILLSASVQPVATLFQSAHFDWTDPLSARAFEQWREAQAHKTDTVTTVANPQLPAWAYTQIKTESADGEIASATITLNEQDYQPLEELLEFRDHQWIELSEISEGDIAGGTLSRPVDSPVRAAEPPSRPAAIAPESSASISDELQVLSVLSAVGADLGDPVEVALSDGKVKVTGDGVPPRRQKEIRDSLANLPHVEVEFRPTQPVVAPPETAPAAGSTIAPPVSPWQPRLQKQLGGHAEFDRFSTQILDLDEAAMQRVYALHGLAQKFSRDDESRLSSKDLELLHEISRKHTAVLAEKVSGMERILLPTLSALGGTAATVRPVTAHAAWQPAVDDVYNDARRVEMLVTQMLGMAQGTASTNGLPSELAARLKQLQADLDECQKFLQPR